MASKKVSKKAVAKATKASVKKTPVKKAVAKATKPSVKAPAKKAVAKATKPSAKKAPVKQAKATAKPPVQPARANAAKAKVSDDGKRNPVAASLDVGAQAPAFSLMDQSGALVSSSELRGKPYVLYFYPKDDTPGCTREACDFRDEYQAFQAAGIMVLGVSPDSSKSHAGFAAKYELPFSLLADPDKVLAKAYGAYGPKQNYGREYMGIIRSTFVVGPSGRVLAAYRGVKVDGHVQKVLARALEGAS